MLEDLANVFLLLELNLLGKISVDGRLSLEAINDHLLSHVVIAGLSVGHGQHIARAPLLTRHLNGRSTGWDWWASDDGGSSQFYSCLPHELV